MLSLPNSGSTWFGALVARHIGARYRMEYFNPVRNQKHEATLRRDFGCEMACCYRNIISPGDDKTHEDIRRTWFVDNDYDFTKEVFSPYKLKVYLEHFEVFVLLRHTVGVFPPSRGRVYSYYEHAWQALYERGGHVLLEQSMRNRAMEAHRIMARDLRKEATELGVPIVYYEDLFGDATGESLSRVNLDRPNLLAEIESTRRSKRINWDEVY